MRYFLLFWLFPVGFLVGWYVLSVNDWSGGMWFFSRDMHDMVFGIYGEVLGIAPETIPPLVAKALVLDTFIILGLIALRRRKAIMEWWHTRRQQAQLRRRIAAMSEVGPAAPAE
ncbi:MAG: DUF6105 family protein [Rhizobiaceae bacterium]|jgi:hypothetical protein|nr:DUF6105 family protein [Rhizobiaceae bacterium]